MRFNAMKKQVISLVISQKKKLNLIPILSQNVVT